MSTSTRWAAPRRYIGAVTTKTYGQMCPIARSLDVLGERWSILVIRELLLGPKRFKHLLAALPGIGSNRLSDRLRGLEDGAIVRKTVLPAPATVPVYELTVDGERLRDPLLTLGLWGLDLPLDGELVDGDGRRRRQHGLADDARVLEPSQPVGEAVAPDAGEGGEEVLEALGSEQQLSDHEDGPSFAEDVERAGERAHLPVGLRGQRSSS